MPLFPREKKKDGVVLTENGRKYHYRRLLIAAIFLCFAVLAAALWLCFTPNDPRVRLTNVQSDHRMTFTVIPLVISMFILPERMNRYVALYDAYCHFHSFRFLKKREAGPLNMTYRNIDRLDYQKKLGCLEYLYVYEGSLPKPVKLSFTLQRHRELFALLCLRVEAANSDAAISPELKALADARREKMYQ